MEVNKIYKFAFIADVKTVTLALKFPCVVSVFWKRGEKAAEVKERKQIEKGVVRFNEKLEIQCNMVFNTKNQVFEEKKTKFTIVIFSEKGTKQAGEVYLDVAELLNSKSKKIPYEKNLEKCPDKNAKFSFQLSGYMKQQISADTISQASSRTLNVEALPSSNIKPNFKKKKRDQSSDEDRKELSKNKSQRNLLPVSRQNIPKVQFIALEQENKRLREQMKELKTLEVENQNLKKQCLEAEKKLKNHLKKKYEELKQEYREAKQKSQSIRIMKENRKNLQKQLYESKNQMADILNYAITNNISELAEQFYSIYEIDEKK